MSRILHSKRPSASKKEKAREWPAVVYFWSFGSGILSYVVARVVLDGRPHPYHWLGGIIGGLAGIPLGWLWYRWRGDVF